MTTRHGFIGELLDDTSAYFVESGSAAAVGDMLIHIDQRRGEAQRKADIARSTVQERFMEATVLGRLRDLYRSVLRLR